MRWSLALLVAVSACRRPPPTMSVSRGAIVFSPSAFADAGVALEAVLVDEAEVIQSPAFAARIVVVLRLANDAHFAPNPAGMVTAALVAKQRAGTLLLDVTASDTDPQVAVRLCNVAMEQYLDERLRRRQLPHLQHLLLLNDLKGEGKPISTQELREEEIAAHSPQNDAAVFEACTMQDGFPSRIR